MMSFLDLSTASEDERRLINEILSDTSVVNFAEPLKQQFHQQQLQPTKLHQFQNPKAQLQQQPTKLQQPQQQQQQHLHQQQPQSIKVNSNNSNSGRVQHRHQHHPNQNHQHHDHQNHYHHQHQAHHNVTNVIGMDVAPSQPAGYAIPPIPPQTHGFGPPPPPPPHHVYGGPPIFQPYTTHYFITPYNLQPYPLPPLVLPPNNPVAPNRQQQSEEIIKISPDETVDIQANLNVSKQSHESSSNSSGGEKPKSSSGDCNDSGTEQSTQESTESVDRDEKSQQNQDINLSPSVTLLTTSQPDCNDSGTEQSTQESSESIDRDEKSQQNQSTNKAATGPWGSASSKSWASLFKGDIGAHPGSTMNGDNEPNSMIDSDNSEGDESRNNHKNNNNRLETNSKNNSASTEEQRSQDAARRALDKLAPKLAQKINSITLKHSLPLLRPRGFINKGNGCYINSTLQALIACPPFYNLMKEIGDLKGLKRENSCTPILDSFVELFLNFPPLDASKKSKQAATSVDQKLQMNYLQAEAIEPRCIYNVLGQIKSECLKGAQEDAEEFLSSVLNGLHEEMIGLSETLQYVQDNSNNQNGHLSDAEEINGDSNNDENLWREVGPKNRSLPIRTATVINSPIQEIFGGSLFSIRTAGKDRCGHRSPFFDLQLDISSDNVKSLQDAIKSFTATEIIQDFYCSKTKQKLDAQRRTSLDQLPPILILHLKQFIYTQDHGLKKLMKRIEYPIDFELPDSCLHDKNSDKSLRNSRTYKLLAVVYHEGKEAVKGHYLTDVYHIGSSQWIRCDDSNLKVVPAPRIENPDSSRTPYLLFYRRLNTLGPRQSNSHDNKKKS